MPESEQAPKPAPDPRLGRLSARLPDHLLRFVASGTALIRSRSQERSAPLPTSIPELDRSLAGGLPRGSLVEITGRRSSGRFSLALSTLAATTGGGDVAVLVDLGDALDPANALELGVDLDRLLWLRPKRLKPALVATEIAIQAGFPLVVLDLGEPPLRGGRGSEAAWLRLTRAATAYCSVVFVSSPYRVSGSAATTVLEAGSATPLWRGGRRAPYLLETLRLHWQLQKIRNRPVHEGLSCTLTSPDAVLGDAAAEDSEAKSLPSSEAKGVDRYQAIS